jgi:hypothetical protein
MCLDSCFLSNSVFDVGMGFASVEDIMWSVDALNEIKR